MNNIKTLKIDHLCLSMDEFKNYYLKNNYNENMFNKDGSINLNYNSKKKTGLIAQIFEDYWFSLPSDIKQSILKYKPNTDKEINKIIDCHNKNIGCSVYKCPDCGDISFIGHTCKSRFCSSCGYKYKLERVENILSTAYNCNHRQIVFTCAKELWHYFFIFFNDLIDIYFLAVNKTIYSVLNESFKALKNKLYKKYTKGFYVYAEKKKFKNMKSWSRICYSLLWQSCYK